MRKNRFVVVHTGAWDWRVVDAYTGKLTKWPMMSRVSARRYAKALNRLHKEDCDD